MASGNFFPSPRLSPRGKAPPIAASPSMRPPILRAYLLTCPARAAVRAATLREFAGTDWGTAPDVFHNRSRLQPPWQRTVHGFPRLLRQALRARADYFLLLEDDLHFNLHLRHNLRTWPPLRERQLHFGSLYDPGMLRRAADPAARWFHAEPTRVLGSQALLLSRACARHLLARWETLPWHHDLRAALLAAELGPLYYHTPSLVQHRPGPSTWAGPPHTAPDFDPHFRA